MRPAELVLALAALIPIKRPLCLRGRQGGFGSFRRNVV